MNTYYSREVLACDAVCQLSCNLDDMLPEDIGYAMERLLEAGALDVYTIPIGMKKNRPGVMLCCLCPWEDADDFAQLMLHHTTTFGVRLQKLERRTLRRQTDRRDTALGEVRFKAAAGKEKPEFEDLARIARTQDLSLPSVRRIIAGQQEEPQ